MNAATGFIIGDGLMEITFAVEPGPQQRSRLNSIRERANVCFPKPKYHVTFDEYCPAFQTVIITVTVAPDPPYGPIGRHSVFPDERALCMDWPEPQRTPPGQVP